MHFLWTNRSIGLNPLGTSKDFLFQSHLNRFHILIILGLQEHDHVVQNERQNSQNSRLFQGIHLKNVDHEIITHFMKILKDHPSVQVPYPHSINDFYKELFMSLGWEAASPTVDQKANGCKAAEVEEEYPVGLLWNREG